MRGAVGSAVSLIAIHFSSLITYSYLLRYLLETLLATLPYDFAKGKLLRPQRELKYLDLVEHQFDPNTTVLLALE